MSLPAGRRHRAIVHVSDIIRNMLARLPWDYPDYCGLPAENQEVVSAVRASMSIPFFFVPVRTATQFTLSKEQQAPFRSGARAATSFLIRWAQAGGIPRGTSPAGSRQSSQPSRRREEPA